MTRQALEGVRVVDVSRVIAGPACSMVLADLGADVVRVEELQGDWFRAQPGELYGFLHVNRNKHSIALDLKQPQGREIVRRLMLQADVFLENFRPGAMARLGLDYEAVREANQRLVYCSITAFGEDGPYASRPGMDLAVQATSGIMGLTGDENGAPAKVGTYLSDVLTSCYAVHGILAALLHRRQTGEGQWVRVAMLDCQVALQSTLAAGYLRGGPAPTRLGSADAALAPSQAFVAGDGAWFVVSVGTDADWEALCRLLAWPPQRQARFATAAQRLRQRPELAELLQAAFRQRPRQDWLDVLGAAGLACAPLLAHDELFRQPDHPVHHLVARLAGAHAAQEPCVALPLAFSETPASVRAPAPLAGQQTRAILSRLGYSQQHIEDLLAARVVAEPAAGEGIPPPAVA